MKAHNKIEDQPPGQNGRIEHGDGVALSNSVGSSYVVEFPQVGDYISEWHTELVPKLGWQMWNEVFDHVHG